MRPNTRNLILWSLIALAAMFAATAWSLASRAALRVWTLPDGSTLAVEGVTFGGEHRFIHGSEWQRLVLSMLWGSAHTDFMQQFRCRDSRFPSRGGESLVVWTFLRKASRTSPWYPRVVALDEQGRESQTGWPRAADYLDAPPMERVDAWELPSFPRRGRTLRLRISHFERGGRHLRIGELTIPNPAPGPHPSWEPEPLPVTQPQGDREFTLTGLTTGITQEAVLMTSGRALRTIYGDPVAGSRAKAWTRADFRITRHGEPDPAWEPVGVTLSDATGNQFAPRQPTPSREGSTARLYFPGALFPDEPAWKLRVEFARAAAFAPAELWTVRGLGVPERDGSVDSPATLTRGDVTLRLLELRANDTFADRRRQTGKRFTLHVFARVTPWSEDRRLTLVRATDGRGRPLAARFGSAWDSNSYFQVHNPTPVKTVDLTFAVHRSRFVEFVAAPSRS